MIKSQKLMTYKILDNNLKKIQIWKKNNSKPIQIPRYIVRLTISNKFYQTNFHIK